MGGGGAIRAAAKFAGINSVVRGVSPAAVTRRASAARQPEEVSWAGLSAASQSNNPIDAAAQRPSWELDEWEFAGAEGDAVLGEPLPRMVFGGAPSLEEAKEATNELKDALDKHFTSEKRKSSPKPREIRDGCCRAAAEGVFNGSPSLEEAKEAINELKDALDKIYLSSPNPTGYQEADESALSLIPKQEYLETKDCVVSEDMTRSLPTNAFKAFKLLNESSAAQSVVASIASDPNVWHAVLQNEALSEFLQSQKTVAPFPDTDSVVEEFVSDPSQGISKSSYGSGKSSKSGNWFVDFLEGIKRSVVEMKNGLADFFQDLFGGPTSVKVNEGTDASAGETFMEKAVGASFIGLAVMVIMLVVLKRP